MSSGRGVEAVFAFVFGCRGRTQRPHEHCVRGGLVEKPDPAANDKPQRPCGNARLVGFPRLVARRVRRVWPSAARNKTTRGFYVWSVRRSTCLQRVQHPQQWGQYGAERDVFVRPGHSQKSFHSCCIRIKRRVMENPAGDVLKSVIKNNFFFF